MSERPVVGPHLSARSPLTVRQPSLISNSASPGGSAAVGSSRAELVRSRKAQSGASSLSELAELSSPMWQLNSLFITCWVIWNYLDNLISACA